MASITSSEKAKQLLDAGHISQDLYDRMTAGSSTTPTTPDAPESAAGTPDDLSDVVHEANPMKERENISNYYNQFPGIASPSGRADSAVDELSQLRAADPGSLSASDDARLKDLEAQAAGTPGRAPSAAIPPAPGQPGAAPGAAGPVGPAAPPVALPGDNKGQPNQMQSEMLKAQQGQQQGYEMEKAANANALIDMQKRNAMQDAAYRDGMARIDKLNQDTQTHEAIRQQAWDDASKKFDAAVQTKIDPDRFWKNQNTGQRIATGIGLFLGAFGAIGNGGQNTAMKVIDDAINRDIDAQKADASKNIQAQTGMMSIMRDKFGDERQAEAATRASAWDRVKLGMENMAQQTNSAQVKAQLISGIGAVTVKQNEAKMEGLKALQASGAMSDMSNDTAKVMNFANAHGIKTDEALNAYSAYKTHQGILDDAGKSFDTAAQTNSLANRGLSPVQAPAQIAAEETKLMQYARQSFGQRWNPEIKDELQNVMPGLKDDAGTLAKKRQTYMSLVEANAPKDMGIVDALGLRRKPLATLGKPI